MSAERRRLAEDSAPNSRGAQEDMERDFKVGDRTVRPRLNQIDKPHGTTTVEARSMAVLVDLATHAGEVRTRQELLEAVWGEAFVTEEVLSHCVWDLRRAFGDSARRSSFIQTVPRRGYRLIATVSWLDASPGESSRYRLLEQLGSGSMGVVWKAEDTLLHRSVALKFLPAELSRDPAAKERFLREARIAAALDHVNICTLYEIGETDDGRLFLVLAYLAGETLKQRLKQGAVPWREAAALSCDVARGLQAAHAAGIVHRDVKPANLMLVPQEAEIDQLRILDFGIARLGDETQRSQPDGSSAGTPAYKSPEQTLGQKVDQRTDLWALGVVLYEMLAGQRPFVGDYEQAVVHAILHQEPAPLAEEIPAALQTVVERLLVKDPDKRYQQMSEVLAELEALPREGEATPSSSLQAREAERASPTDRAGEVPPCRKSRFRLWTACLLLLVVLGMVGYRWRESVAEPLRVVVARPEVVAQSKDENFEFVALGVLVAVLNSLTDLEGLTVLDPSEVGDEPGSPTAMARAAAADEVVISELEKQGELGVVTLRRVHADGRVLWSDRFELRMDYEATTLRADRVRFHLRQAYAGFSSRSELESNVREQDYQRFLELWQRHDAGQPIRSEDLEALDQLIATSPRFLEAHLVLAQWAAADMQYRRRFDDLDHFLRRAEEARQLAPDDHRPLEARFRLERAAGRFDRATSTLDILKQKIPGTATVVDLEASLLADQGQLDEALALRRTAVELWPSWKSFFLLADLEYRMGDEVSARRHLEELLELVPGSRAGLSKLAELELFYGDLVTSAKLYHQLAARHEHRGYWTNLGTAELLRGDYARAVESYEKALELAPEHPVVLVNLAEAQQALGQDGAASASCRQALEVLENNERRGELGAIDRMLKALCLARTGRVKAAVELAQETLQIHPQEAQVTYQVAMVYALAGELTSALVNAERAYELGVQSRWFKVPAFGPLRDEPSLTALLKEASGGKS